ncbi:MAG TPA: FAD-dependent oxidoreductase [Burkholderiales bacterium]|nr:FAD-dependent oxidoreductase [Burkholderiales bacterium]
MLPENPQVLIVGGGPCGLMLANELGRRGVSALVLDQKPGTAFNPQANATQARTMEHYRRLGFADEIRALGMPEDFPTDIAYFTRFATHELARFRLPSAREARKLITTLSGSWSAAELPHRVAQKFVEQVLRRHAERVATVHYGWRVTSVTDHGNHVEAQAEPVDGGKPVTLRCEYLVGADGARSVVRQAMGWRYSGETGVVRDFFGGRMFAVYCRIPDFYREIRHAPAWMNVGFNPERRFFMAAIDGRVEFAYHTQLKPHEEQAALTEEHAIALAHQGIGVPLKIEVLSLDTWTAGYSLVAERFASGRVFIGGDAAHLFTPTGGLGYNTAVEDAVNLGWKLAAVLKGRAAPRLLESYEIERKPLAMRNTAYAKRFADSLGNFQPVPHIEDETPQGAAARKQAGEYLEAHGRAEFNIPGITFGGRYDGSPAIVADGTSPPPEAANTYVPTACPGGRPPHAWLPDGRSLYDAFGFEWTLLCLNHASPPIAPDVKVVHLQNDALRDAYQADYALIRPDQIVAWRGNEPPAALNALEKLRG